MGKLKQREIGTAKKSVRVMSPPAPIFLYTRKPHPASRRTRRLPTDVHGAQCTLGVLFCWPGNCIRQWRAPFETNTPPLTKCPRCPLRAWRANGGAACLDLPIVQILRDDQRCLRLGLLERARVGCLCLRRLCVRNLAESLTIRPLPRQS